MKFKLGFKGVLITVFQNLATIQTQLNFIVSYKVKLGIQISESQNVNDLVEISINFIKMTVNIYPGMMFIISNDLDQNSFTENAKKTLVKLFCSKMTGIEFKTVEQ